MKDKTPSNDSHKARIHQRFKNVLQVSWAEASRNHTDQLTEAEINAEIREVRKTNEMKGKK